MTPRTRTHIRLPLWALATMTVLGLFIGTASASATAHCANFKLPDDHVPVSINNLTVTGLSCASAEATIHPALIWRFWIVYWGKNANDAPNRSTEHPPGDWKCTTENVYFGTKNKVDQVDNTASGSTTVCKTPHGKRMEFVAGHATPWAESRSTGTWAWSDL